MFKTLFNVRNYRQSSNLKSTLLALKYTTKTATISGRFLYVYLFD